jgi:hypothetical protein
VCVYIFIIIIIIFCSFSIKINTHIDTHTLSLSHTHSWVVRKHSVSRLQRNFTPSLIAIVAAVCVQTTVAMCLNEWDVRTSERHNEAKTIAYVEYIVVHVCTQITILWFYIGTCWSLVGHIRGGQKVGVCVCVYVWMYVFICLSFFLF